MSEELRYIERKWQEKWFDSGIFHADSPSSAEEIAEAEEAAEEAEGAEKAEEKRAKERAKESAKECAKKKFYLNVAYPYPSGAMHVGHGRTYTVPDVIARFKRMKGFNVLFPMAFHVTGTPVIGISRRIAMGDESAIRLYRDIYRVPEEELRKFVEPERIVAYFTAEYKRIMQELGLSIDWRRCFTTVDPHYQKFIRWQFNKLNAKGYVTKGVHPVKYCPSCGNPVGDHDLLAGEGASILEFTLLKFPFHLPEQFSESQQQNSRKPQHSQQPQQPHHTHEEREKEENNAKAQPQRSSNNVFLPVATLRPETIFGVTNIWVNPSGKYVIARVRSSSVFHEEGKEEEREDEKSGREQTAEKEEREEGDEREEREEIWVVSEECASKLKYQGYSVDVEGELRGEDLIGEFAENPMSGERVEILPADFVDLSFGTGVVMSVPAHAPYDFVALSDLHRSGKYLHISPITIIRTDEYGGGEDGRIPAEVIVKRMGIVDQHDKRLEDATETLYAAEFNKGVMTVGEYAGMRVSEARERVKEEMKSRGLASTIYEFSERPVVCRCNTPVVVSLISDQWFLRYDDEEWKSEVRELLSEIAFVPPEIKVEFEQTVEWLRAWACARRIGLGTKLPWDERWIIEPLSDSTIYMAYYTIAHLIKGVNPECLNDDVFDYIFLGEEKGGESENYKDYENIRSEFVYWYPYDFRFSARDLVRNHLTFQLFHHVAVFPRELCPKGIVVFGMATKDGRKMSSSKGNIVLLSDAIERYGADAVRLFLLSAAEPWQDFDWRDDLAFAAKKHIERFFNTANEIISFIQQNEKEREKREKREKREEHEKEREEPPSLKDTVSKWLLSRIQHHIIETTSALEGFQCRKALQHAFFGMENDLRWFRRRVREPDADVLRYVLDVWVRLLAPFIPHVCEEIWSKMGRKGFVSLAPYPEAREDLIDMRAEISEEILAGVVDDVNEILKVTGISPKKIVLFVAESWKKDVFTQVSKMMREGKGVKEILPALMRSGDERIKEHRKEIPEFVRKIVERLNEKGWSNAPEVADVDELALLRDAKEFLEREFGCEFEIYSADAVDDSVDPKKRRRSAIPTRPAIFVT